MPRPAGSRLRALAHAARARHTCAKRVVATTARCQQLGQLVLALPVCRVWVPPCGLVAIQAPAAALQALEAPAGALHAGWGAVPGGTAWQVSTVCLAPTPRLSCQRPRGADHRPAATAAARRRHGMKRGQAGPPSRPAHRLALPLVVDIHRLPQHLPSAHLAAAGHVAGAALAQMGEHRGLGGALHTQVGARGAGR